MLRQKSMKPFWIAGTFFSCVFLILLFIRMELLPDSITGRKTVTITSTSVLPERDIWMNIFQNDRKIGYSHTLFQKKESGYYLQENVFMRINTMGLVQSLNVKTTGTLNKDLTLSSFHFNLSSSRFSFSAEGTVSGNILSIKTESAGTTSHADIELKEPPFLAAGIIQSVISADAGPGDKLVFSVFDPATMGQENVLVTVMEKEDIISMGVVKTATKILLNFKGAEQTAWVGEDGDILKESGMLGLTMVKTNRKDALFGVPIEPSKDMTKIASVPSNIKIADPEKLDMLMVKITGIPLESVTLDGGRQKLKGDILTVFKENMTGTPASSQDEETEDSLKPFLEATPFVQSDHPEIKALVKKTVSKDDTSLEKAQKLFDWVHNNIKKRPVLSVPNALSTLDNRIGDCNEHSVLLAALLRAAGIPARVEAGVVYLRGRFYYHAWNIFYTDRWITADSLFGQIPADATHIRLVSGDQKLQLDLMGIIGKLKLEVIEQ